MSSRQTARPTSRWVITALLIATALSASGCGQTGARPAPSSPGRPAAAGPEGDPPTGPRPGSADGFLPDWIDGLQIVNDASEDADCPWSSSYPAVPGATALTAALRSEVEARTAGLRQDAPLGVPCRERPLTPGLHIAFAFLVASDDVVGVRLSTQDAASAGSGLSTTTSWYDGRTGTVSKASALLAPARLPALTELIRQALAGRPGADADTAASALSPRYRAATLSDLAFSGEGDLHVRFAPGAVAVVPAGWQEVVIPGAQATELLSGFGQRVQEQTVHPSRRLTLADPAAGPSASSPAAPSAPTAAVPSRVTRVNCRRVKCVALTFDDGPGPATQRLLQTLDRYHARATFFVVGQNVVANPELVRAELAAGHEVGNHSWSHADLTKLSAVALRNQFRWTDRALEKATGPVPALVRPPYGAVSARVRDQAGRPLILWDVDTEDWKYRTRAHVVHAALSTVRPGDIVLMHDIHPTTVDAVPQILRTLQARGYHFVTVSQLMKGTTLRAGRTYRDNPAAR